MLKLSNIVKEYPTGDEKVVALNDVNIEFRKSEFVSILGHSGCGKTTLLNIIGGLDQYTSGDLSINGKSTKAFKDSDWDTYRNHSVGFVFQNYNLIPHQSVLANVELALTLSGVSKTERKERAKAALEKVGLGNQINKKPNQMSGGQMQRVAIARALVNNPEILLADEPTGALDSETSVQVMDLLKEISKDRLVIMVTHNPELADEYSTRIIRLVDGKIVNDSNPYDSSEEEKSPSSAPVKETRKEKKAKKKTSMSFATALSLSLNNLMTKKMRTFLTSFAGSIGIIGIALILALSNGFTLYIEAIQREALTSYPIMIESATMDMEAMMGSMESSATGEVNHDLDKVYPNTIAASMMDSFSAGTWTNDLESFKAYIESDRSHIRENSSSIRYTYGGSFNIFASDYSQGANKVYPSPITDFAGDMMGTMGMGAATDMMGMASMETMMSAWQELIDSPELIDEQYDVVAGTLPKNYNEVVLIIDRNNEISDRAIQGLGYMTADEMMDSMMSSMTGGTYTPYDGTFEYDEIIGKTYKIVLEPDYYVFDEATGTWTDMHGNTEYENQLIENGEEVRIVGIIKPAAGSLMSTTTGAIGYTADLTEHIINRTNECEIVIQQKANPEVDVFTGLRFDSVITETPEEEEPVTPEVPADTPVDVPAEAPADVPEAPTEINSVDDLYQLIDANYKGEINEELTRTIDLVFKDSLTNDEKAELVTLLEKYNFLEGSGFSADQAVDMLGMATESMLLDIIADGMTSGNSSLPAPNINEPDEPVETPEATDPVVPETPEEPEVEVPTPLCATYEEALTRLGVADLSKPKSIYIYPKDFESKDMISAEIAEYNQNLIDSGKEESEIKYTDMIGLLLSSVTKIVDVISYVLIAFVAISLVVSSIMIGIITYISVLERTKEIGILRAIGASKRDISRVFNAETLIVGFVSGALGIGITLLLTIPINLIIDHLTSIAHVAQLPVAGGIILVLISMALTLIAGLVPSRIAAKKDPVEALRTE